MEYLLRKFKSKHKSKGQTPPKMVVTSPRPMTSDGSSDSTRFEFELEDRRPANHVPRLSPQRVECKASDSHNYIGSDRHSLHDSQHSSNSSPSMSSGSATGPQDMSSNLSTIAKLILSRPLEVKRNHCEQQIIQIRDNTFAVDCLFWHNVFRAKHGSPPLVLSLPLIQMAQEWANYLAHTDTFKYRNTAGVGENLMSKWTCHPDYDPPAESIVRFWYSEVSYYNFEIDPSIMHTLANHFTQLVWKSTEELGIGKAHTRGGRLIVVANYRPPGNQIGLFHENVLTRVGKDKDKTSADKKKTYEWEDLYSLNDNSITQSQSLLDHH